MIFSGSYNGIPHFDMVLNGTKTQTRRISDRYEVESERKYPHKVGYSIQKCRTCKGIVGRRIVIDRKWKEETEQFLVAEDDKMYPSELCITTKDALGEGGYTPDEYEKEFKRLNPKWDGWSRWAYKYRVIEVQK